MPDVTMGWDWLGQLPQTEIRTRAITLALLALCLLRPASSHSPGNQTRPPRTSRKSPTTLNVTLSAAGAPSGGTQAASSPTNEITSQRPHLRLSSRRASHSEVKAHYKKRR